MGFICIECDILAFCGVFLTLCAFPFFVFLFLPLLLSLQLGHDLPTTRYGTLLDSPTPPLFLPLLQTGWGMGMGGGRSGWPALLLLILKNALWETT